MINEQPSIPPPYKEDRVGWIKLLNQLIFSLFLVLVGYLIKVMSESGREEALSVFMEICNQAFLVLILLFVGLGFWEIIQRSKGRHQKDAAEKALKKPLQTLSIAVLYTTFAYAIAGLIIDIRQTLILFSNKW